MKWSFLPRFILFIGNVIISHFFINGNIKEFFSRENIIASLGKCLTLFRLCAIIRKKSWEEKTVTNIVFSFDVEDYINPAGADSVLRYAEILRKENIKGCFKKMHKIYKIALSGGVCSINNSML